LLRLLATELLLLLQLPLLLPLPLLRSGALLASLLLLPLGASGLSFACAAGSSALLTSVEREDCSVSLQQQQQQQQDG
jgi:hypothetical protein